MKNPKRNPKRNPKKNQQTRKILIVTGIQVFPPQSGGQLRTANLAKSLARAGHEVQIYSYTGRKKDYLQRRSSGETVNAPNLREYVNRSVPNGVLQFLTYKLGLPNIWFSLPLPFLQLPKDLRKRTEWAEVLIVDFPFHYQVLKASKGQYRVLNSHNVEHHIPHGGKFSRPWIAKIVRRIETKAAKEVDAVFCCGKEDKAFYRNLGGKELRLLEVPNALDLSGSTPPVGSRLETIQSLGLDPRKKYILFTASKYGPNQEAFRFLRQFARNGHVGLERLGVEFLVVGSVTPTPFREPGFIATSFVPEVTPYFQVADYSINPVTTGSGTNVKVFEYLANQLPLFSTEFGIRGFNLTDGEDYFKFTANSLMSVLETTLKTSADLSPVAERALSKNAHLCDMDTIIERVVQPVLRTFKGPSGLSPGSTGESFSAMPLG